MKLLKPLLIVLSLFLFNSCTTTEDEIITNQKVTFDADYLANSEEFTILSNLLNEAFNDKNLTLDKLHALEADNEELFSLFSKKVSEETNFSEFLKTGDISNLMKPILTNTNKSITLYQSQMLAQTYTMANVINSNDYNRFGNDQRHQLVNLRHMQVESQVFQLRFIAMQQQNAVSNSFFNSMHSLLSALASSARR